MDIRELCDALPKELRVKPDQMPPEVAEAIEYMADCNAMRDAGIPESDIPAVEMWRGSGQ
jgi:hypothetical protein